MAIARFFFPVFQPSRPIRGCSLDLKNNRLVAGFLCSLPNMPSWFQSSRGSLVILPETEAGYL